MTTPDAIRAIRESLGDSPAEFARRLGVTHGAVSHWESGRREPSGTATAQLAALAADGGAALLAALLDSQPTKEV